MGRSFLAVLSGYAAMTIVVLLVSVAATQALIPPGGTWTMPYLATSLAGSAVGAVIGGWVAARLAPESPVAHGAALAGVGLAIALLQLRSSVPRAASPTWYLWASLAIGVLGPYLGGWWRALQLRRSATAGRA